MSLLISHLTDPKHRESTSISHCTHPKHSLVKTAGREGRFTCDMCEAAGSGDRYRCDACDFDLHEDCAGCPATLPSFFAHPLHPLNLVPPLADPRGPMRCDFCYHPIRGYSYRCSACCFNLHPLCSLLPHTVRSDLHPQHPLTLHPAAAAACAACRENCVIWRYRCGLCMFELHTYCLRGAAPAHSASTSGDGGSGDGGKKGGHVKGLVKVLGHAALDIAVEIIGNTIGNAIS